MGASVSSTRVVCAGVKVGSPCVRAGGSKRPFARTHPVTRQAHAGSPCRISPGPSGSRRRCVPPTGLGDVTLQNGDHLGDHLGEWQPRSCVGRAEAGGGHARVTLKVTRTWGLLR